MEIFKELFQLNIPYIIIGILVILSVAIALYEMIGKISKMIGKPVKWVREKEKDHELILQTSKGLEELHKQYEESVRQSIRHDEMIKNDLSALADTVNNIADTLNEMQKKDNATKLKELKDSLIRYYNKYKNIGEWSKLEKDAFWDLFDDYEKRGGDGYIHSIVEPVMRELREID